MVGLAQRCCWLAGLVWAMAATSLHAAEPVLMKLWPQGAPEAAGFKPGLEHTEPPRDGRQWRLMNVSEPTVSLYRPPRPNGTAVVVAPGGAYQFLAIEHEGTQVCERLVAQGITCLLLRYRVPFRSEADPGREALQDAQRAMGLVKRRAAEWGVSADRVGFLGFSAGGHLALRLALQTRPRSHAFDPALDVDDTRPAFAIPVYPAFLVDKDDAGRLSAEFKVSPTAPPMCLVHADDDKGLSTSAGSALLYLEYKKLNRPAELHIFAKGGHGFGLKPIGGPTGDWLQRVTDWMGAMGWLGQ
jgi:acetyl esterase/lipase